MFLRTVVMMSLPRRAADCQANRAPIITWPAVAQRMERHVRAGQLRSPRPRRRPGNPSHRRRIRPCVGERAVTGLSQGAHATQQTQPIRSHGTCRPALMTPRRRVSTEKNSSHVWHAATPITNPLPPPMAARMTSGTSATRGIVFDNTAERRLPSDRPLPEPDAERRGTATGQPQG